MWYLLGVWFGFVGLNEAELNSRVGFLAIALIFTLIGITNAGTRNNIK